MNFECGGWVSTRTAANRPVNTDMKARHHFKAKAVQLMSLLAILASFPASALADALDKTATFTPTVSFSESFIEKVVSTNDAGTITHEVVASESADASGDGATGDDDPGGG